MKHCPVVRCVSILTHGNITCSQCWLGVPLALRTAYNRARRDYDNDRRTNLEKTEEYRRAFNAAREAVIEAANEMARA